MQPAIACNGTGTGGKIFIRHEQSVSAFLRLENWRSGNDDFYWKAIQIIIRFPFNDASLKQGTADVDPRPRMPMFHSVWRKQFPIQIFQIASMYFPCQMIYYSWRRGLRLETRSFKNWLKHQIKLILLFLSFRRKRFDKAPAELEGTISADGGSSNCNSDPPKIP